MEELEKTSRGGRPGYGPTTKSQELRVGVGGPGTTPGGDENVSFFRGILLELNTRNQVSPHSKEGRKHALGRRVVALPRLLRRS